MIISPSSELENSEFDLAIFKRELSLTNRSRLLRLLDSGYSLHDALLTMIGDEYQPHSTDFPDNIE